MRITFAPRLLVKTIARAGNQLSLAGEAIALRELCPNESLNVVPGAQASARWYVVDVPMAAKAPTAAEMWDLAHDAAREHHAYVEPDAGAQWDYQNSVTVGLGAAPGDLCQYNDQSDEFPKGSGFAWHLKLSQLKCAREQVEGTPAKVRIGHLDTGYDPAHQARPQKLLLALQHNFVDDGRPRNDASDPYARGLFTNPGHGTGTIGLLAGGFLRDMARPEQNRDFLGGAPLAEVLPVRIANGVVLLFSSTFAAGLDYLIAPNGNAADRVDVVSMSMGGLASKAWADVVNRAYDAGIVMVTAAGNNFALCPQSIVYPARFRRVIAACGVMADGRAYIRANVPLQAMAGNYGPDSKMDTALAAYTPNTSWAEINCEALIDMNGAGTSSATPQIAAAAALWLQKYKPDMSTWAPHEVVEATRKALFDAADKGSPDAHKYFGQGIIQAANALAIAPQAAMPATPKDNAWFPFWKVVIGQGVAAKSLSPAQQEMLGVEVAQLFQLDPTFEEHVSKVMPDPDLATEPPPEFFDAVIGSPHASMALKTALKDRFVSAAVPGADLGKASGPEPPKNREFPAPQPKHRMLRVYATDPSLSQHLDTAFSNEITIPVKWEKLERGPVGEYLEVMDNDPASACFYDPVDLEDPNLLATDGQAPNPGYPHFHQQMVYAVAMRTIVNFEKALGRKALWSPMISPGTFDDSHYVQRLRIHPHAFRGQNAYYNPDKKALLFGYFPVQGCKPGELYPDGLAFTCLSHDIVAHETTHALLDGMHRNLSAEESVDDLAFHEAFADIVALFQHFSLSDIARTELAQARGDIDLAQRLGEIGQEFGYATGMHRALRSAINRPPDPEAIGTMNEPHDRGSLLVAAVFLAFTKIYKRRTADLFRIATRGSGQLKPGAIDPDLVGRLAKEAQTAARHVLTMCIRALDYCAPVGLNFGDYLRALITADFQVSPEDELGYRIAFVEAFREWGIYPSGLQTLSPQSLQWLGLQYEISQRVLGEVFEKAREFADGWRYLEWDKRYEEMSLRERQFRFARDWRGRLHDVLAQRIRELNDTDRAMLGADLGLDFSTGREPFELHSLRVAEKIGPDNELNCHLLVQLLQHRTEIADGTPFTFSGGATLVIDERSLEVTYAITRGIGSKTRLAEARAAFSAARNLESVYFAGTPFTSNGERFALVHKSGSNAAYDERKRREQLAQYRLNGHKKSGRAKENPAVHSQDGTEAHEWKARIRMYRKWLGDCFLLTFHNGVDRHIMIDCGALVGTPDAQSKIAAAVESIARETDGSLAAIVLTHEHWDHVSGFVDAADAFKEFKQIDNVWVAWTEDPDAAVTLQSKKLRMDAVKTALRSWASSATRGDQERGAAVQDMMGFTSFDGIGAASDRTATAMENAKNLGALKFLTPGDVISDIPGLRVYVLGPPKDMKSLHTMMGKVGTDMYGLALAPSEAATLEAFATAGGGTANDPRQDKFIPFPSYLQWDKEAWSKAFPLLASHYASEPARQIDTDWLNAAAEFAVQLDSYTNNTSLVLAFEFIDSGEVLLFVGDAQIGNWKSWATVTFPDATVTVPDLLARTVYYKVGHHGSHNATLEDGGLEAMTSPQLVAAIPVDENFARNTKHWDMPAGPLLHALNERTSGRVLRADSDFPANATKPPNIESEGWAAFCKNVAVDEHFIDYYVR